MLVYDVIIIGAGAAGLFAGCHFNPSISTLILEKKSKPGNKLLMSGAGQCNLTHGGSIKEFVGHYGLHGKLIRPILYQLNNEMTIRFFKDRGLDVIEREDGKIFPRSLDAKDVVSCLTETCKQRGVSFRYDSLVTAIEPLENGVQFKVVTENESFLANYIIVASGGCSYPGTGSDGTLFQILKKLGIAVTKLNPCLTPVYIENYPYGELSGISFENCGIEVFDGTNKIASSKGDVLFTHKNISGPGILNSSRFMKKGNVIQLNYIGMEDKSLLYNELRQNLNDSGNTLFSTILREHFGIPKRFIDVLLQLLNIDAGKKASTVTKNELQAVINKLISDRLTIEALGGFNVAMATSGGVSLSDIDKSTLTSKLYNKLFFAGEVLDIDGDTGGYNIQFAFSSGFLCAKEIKKRLGILD